MGTLTETATYNATVYRIETTDPVKGGDPAVDGIANKSAQDLANRTKYLKQYADKMSIASPVEFGLAADAQTNLRASTKATLKVGTVEIVAATATDVRSTAPVKGATSTPYSAHGDTTCNVNSGTFDMTPYVDVQCIHVTAASGGPIMVFPEPTTGNAYSKEIWNDTATPVGVTTPLGTDSYTIPAGGKVRIFFVRTAVGTTKVVVVGLTTTDIATILASSPTITGATITGGTIGGCALSGSVITGLGLASPIISGTPVITATSIQATGNARMKVYSDLGNVQTTDATVTTAFSWTILDEACTQDTAEVQCIKSDGSLTGGYVRHVRIKRDGGTVTMGTVQDMFTDEESGFASCDVTIDNSTSTGRVRVTGLAATTIDWGYVNCRRELSHA